MIGSCYKLCPQKKIKEYSTYWWHRQREDASLPCPVSITEALLNPAFHFLPRWSSKAVWVTTCGSWAVHSRSTWHWGYRIVLDAWFCALKRLLFSSTWYWSSSQGWRVWHSNQSSVDYELGVLTQSIHQPFHPYVLAEEFLWNRFRGAQRLTVQVRIEAHAGTGAIAACQLFLCFPKAPMNRILFQQSGPLQKQAKGWSRKMIFLYCVVKISGAT